MRLGVIGGTGLINMDLTKRIADVGGEGDGPLVAVVDGAGARHGDGAHGGEGLNRDADLLVGGGGGDLGAALAAEAHGEGALGGGGAGGGAGALRLYKSRSPSEPANFFWNVQVPR